MNSPGINKTLHILYIEDNPGDVYIVRRALSTYKNPSKLHNITDGESAITYLQNAQGNQSELPDLILLDISLPVVNGDEVLEWIRNEDYLKDLPVIVLSSSFSSPDIKKMQRIGANDYVTKPNDLDGFTRLFQAIESNCQV